MYHDDVGTESVNAWRKDQIERRRARQAMAPEQKAVRRHPGDESEQMRPRQTGNSVPEDYAGVFGATDIGLAGDDILDLLRIKMNFAVVLPRQTFEQFRESALGAMAAIDERRNNGESQVSRSSGCVQQRF